MAENKFIKRLKGKETAKSVVEIKNTSTPTTFANMPAGTSNTFNTYSDSRGDATVVANGTLNWKINGSSLVDAPTIHGDGNDFISSFKVFGNGLWIDSSYTFTEPKIFTPNTKWVLKLCGSGLTSVLENSVELTLLIKFGTSTLISKTFLVSEHSFSFSEELVIDFTESEQSVIKVSAGDTMSVQVLCGDATAEATIYNGMTVFTALQRRTDTDAVASDKNTFKDLEDDIADIQEDIVDIHTELDGKVNINGTSTMTAPLKFSAGSMRGAIGPYLNGVSFWKMDSQGTITNIANLTDSQFLPVSTNSIDLGRSANKWKDLYLAGKVYVATINNGADLSVPNKSGTLATMGDVELAARSGRMLTDQGVWYAKMYSATVAPAAEDGTNYADFSQVDGDNNPIIVIYTRISGAWVQSETITPPADYDGYVPITSKIWDIVEQSGQQGGRVLWNHTSKEFTPYPVIISFEDIEVTGESTVIMPNNPGANQIVNKDYVDNSIGDGTITLTQGGTTKGTFTVNQSGDTTIDLDAGGSGYHPDLFDFKWADHIINDVQWLRADTFSWQAGSTYEAAYNELFNDIYQHTTWYTADTALVRTYTPTPAVGDTVYYDPYPATEAGTITAYDDVNNTITVSNGYTYSYNSNVYVSPTTETVAGITVTYYPGTSGRKIVPMAYMSAVESVYAATGVAWYYIIDVPGKRFKLPRGKHNKYASTLDVAGNGKTLGLTTGNKEYSLSAYSGDGLYLSDTSANNPVGTSAPVTGTHTFGVTYGVSTDSTKSGLTAQQTEDTDQYKYLYFYVGEFTQSAVENTAGLNASLFNEKVDLTSSWSAPIWNASAKTDFTLDVSGSEYTAPADGYFIIQMQNGNLNNHWVNLSVNSIFIGNAWGQVPNNTFGLPVIPVKQGDKLRIDYGSDITGAPVFFHIATQKTN